VCLLYDILQIDSVLKLNELGRFRIALSVRRLRLPRSRLGQLGAQLFDLFLLQFCRIGSLLISYLSSMNENLDTLMEDKLVSFSDMDVFSPFFSGVDGIFSDVSIPDA
jgi:hypothetical protein